MAEQSDYSAESDAEHRPGPCPAPTEILHADQNIWIQEELALLHQLLPEYIAKKKDEKSEFIATTATSKIRKLWGDRYSKVSVKDPQVRAQWKKKKKQVRNWFLNHSKGSRKVKYLGFKSTVTFSSVVDILNKDAVLRECDQLAEGAGRGSREWFKHYRKALQVVRQQLSEDEKQEALETMEKYKLAGYPKEYQATHARRYGRAIIKKADEHRFKTMGMRSLTFECHYNDQGNIVFGIFNQSAFSAFKEAYIDYVEKIFKWDTGQRTDDLSFNANDLGYDDKGLPLLPGQFLRDDVEPLKIKRDILRHYVNKHYELASQGRTQRAPWKEIQEHPEQFYSLDSMPPDIRLQDPSHLSARACTSLLKQWRSQQALGEVPFRFEHVKREKEFVAAEYALGTFKPKSGKPAMAITSPLKKRRRRISDTTDDSEGAPGQHAAGPPETDINASGSSGPEIPERGASGTDDTAFGVSGPFIHNFAAANELPPTPKSKKPSPLPEIQYLLAQHPIDDHTDPPLVKETLPGNEVKELKVDGSEKEQNNVMNSKAGNEKRRPTVRAKVKDVNGRKPLFLADSDTDQSTNGKKKSEIPNLDVPDPLQSLVAEPSGVQPGAPPVTCSGGPDAGLNEGRGHRIKRPKKIDAYLLAQKKEEQYKLQRQRK
ncbi:hypothetical protein CPC08DRAFT_771066 [Agrocybe pediades]|nr:hypothetical protein CPC08DRAFT_771066 [Agrocybe pediades]